MRADSPVTTPKLSRTFSVSQFTESHPNLDRRNFGMTELMIVSTCNQCISLKQKWLSTLELLSMASKRMSSKFGSLENVTVVRETVGPSETISLRRDQNLEKEHIAKEKELTAKTATLHHLLRRYNLAEEISNMYPDFDPANPLEWTSVSFTNLKVILLDIFSTRDTCILASNSSVMSSSKVFDDLLGSDIAAIKRSVSHSQLNYQQDLRVGTSDDLKREHHKQSIEKFASNRSLSESSATAPLFEPFVPAAAAATTKVLIKKPAAIFSGGSDPLSPLFHQMFFEEKSTQ